MNSDHERQEIWRDFKDKKSEQCAELNELIVDAIKWLNKSKDAEAELEEHDQHAEERFAKLHRIRHSQVTVNAVCGCGRAVEAKKTFEKISYSNTTERKLRTILGTIRAQLRDNVALTKARASEQVEKLRFKLDIKHDNELALGLCWVWLNSLIHHAKQLEHVGLADLTQQWICRLVLKHRVQFHVQDELRLLDLFLTLPPGWLARWGSSLLKLPPIDQLEGQWVIFLCCLDFYSIHVVYIKDLVKMKNPLKGNQCQRHVVLH